MGLEFLPLTMIPCGEIWGRRCGEDRGDVDEPRHRAHCRPLIFHGMGEWRGHGNLEGHFFTIAASAPAHFRMLGQVVRVYPSVSFGPSASLSILLLPYYIIRCRANTTASSIV